MIVQAKQLTQDNIQHLFESRLMQKDNTFEVIYLSIHNLSNVSYIVSPADIDIAKLSYQQIFQYMKTSSIGRLTGGIVAIGIPAYPAVNLFTFGCFMKCAIAAYAGLSLAVVGIGLGALCFVLGLKSIKMNYRIDKDLKQKMVHKKVIIKSGDHYEGLIFVKSSDYKPLFNIIICEQDNHDNKIAFEVDLQQE